MNRPQFPLNPLALSIAVALSAPMAVHADVPSFPTNSSETITDRVNLTLTDGTMTVNNVSNNTQITATVTGSGPLIKKGSGTLSLTSTENDYTGGTQVREGTLAIMGDGSLGAGNGSLTVESGATLQTNADTVLGAGRDVSIGGTAEFDTRGNNLTVEGQVQDAGSAGTLVKEGDGSLTLAGQNTHSGGTVVNRGTVIVTEDANLGAGGVRLNGGTLQAGDDIANLQSAIDLDGVGAINTAGNDVTATGVVSGTGTLVKSGAGTLSLNAAANTYNGYIETPETPGNTTADFVFVGTRVSGGTLSISKDAQLGASTAIYLPDPTDPTVTEIVSRAVQLDGGALETRESLSLGRDFLIGNGGGSISTVGTDAPDNVTRITGAVKGGNLTKTGAGTLVLGSIDNEYEQTIIEDGKVVAGSRGGAKLDTPNIGDGMLTLNGGEIEFTSTAGYVLGQGVHLGEEGGVINSRFAGLISSTVDGEGGFTKAGIGTLSLTGANTYDGDTIVKSGVLQVSRDQALGDTTGDVVLDGGTLQVTGSDISTTRDMQIGSANGTLDTTDRTVAVSGNVSGAGQLVKNGSGTLELTGDNSFQGGVKIKEGLLLVDKNEALGSANAGIIIDGAALGIAGTGQTTIDRDLTLTNLGGRLDVAAGKDAVFAGQITGTAAATSDLVKSGAGVLSLSDDNSAFTGDTTVTGGRLGISESNNLGSGLLTLNGGSLRTNKKMDVARTLVVGSLGEIGRASCRERV